jgi:hypothetical protein
MLGAVIKTVVDRLQRIADSLIMLLQRVGSPHVRKFLHARYIKGTPWFLAKSQPDRLVLNKLKKREKDKVIFPCPARPGDLFAQETMRDTSPGVLVAYKTVRLGPMTSDHGIGEHVKSGSECRWPGPNAARVTC